jgi:competence protein ComEC
MTGIIAGAAALIGAAIGWWGVAIVALLMVVVLAVAPSRSRWPVYAVGLAAVVLGAWRAETDPPPSQMSHIAQSAPSALVVTSPVFTGQQQSFAIEWPGEPGLPANGLSARVCVVAGPVPVIRLGDTVEASGKLENLNDLPMGNRAAMSARGCTASLYATSIRVLGSSPSVLRRFADLRTKLDSALRRVAPGDAGVLLSGLVTGDDDGFSTGRRDAFIRTGTTHLTAVSGSNLALVAGILATIGSATIGRHRGLWQVVTILGIWAYALISGAQAPALRAAIVATVAVLAFRFGRRPDFVTLIMLAGGAMVVVEPRQIESLGFRLSVAASLAVVLVLTGILAMDRTSPVTGVLTATLAAQLATLPILLPVFGTVSLTSIPANIIAAPLVAVATPLALVAAIAGLFWPPLGEVIAAPAALAATALIRTIDVLGAPEAYVSVGVPPLSAAAAIAATILVLLFLIGGGAFRHVHLFPRAGALNPRASTRMDTDPNQRVEQLRQPGATGGPSVIAGKFEPLAPALPGLTREDPLDAFTGDLDHAVQDPAGEEEGHEVTDQRQVGEALSAKIFGHLQEAHRGEEPHH